MGVGFMSTESSDSSVGVSSSTSSGMMDSLESDKQVKGETRICYVQPFCPLAVVALQGKYVGVKVGRELLRNERLPRHT